MLPLFRLAAAIIWINPYRPWQAVNVRHDRAILRCPQDLDFRTIAVSLWACIRETKRHTLRGAHPPANVNSACQARTIKHLARILLVSLNLPHMGDRLCTRCSKHRLMTSTVLLEGPQRAALPVSLASRERNLVMRTSGPILLHPENRSAALWKVRSGFHEFLQANHAFSCGRRGKYLASLRRSSLTR